MGPVITGSLEKRAPRPNSRLFKYKRLFETVNFGDYFSSIIDCIHELAQFDFSPSLQRSYCTLPLITRFSRYVFKANLILDQQIYLYPDISLFLFVEFFILILR